MNKESIRPSQVVVVHRLASTPLSRTSSMRHRQMTDPTATTEQRICTKENCLKCFKKFTAFMFSRVGLFFVMIGYVALGGVIFQALEAGNEHDMRHIMDLELNATLHKLWEETLRVNSFLDKDKRGNFSLYATRELEQFEATVIRQVGKGFDGRTTNSEHDWNFFGAALYAVTLVSTIGYGHITTKTTQGKIATILYSAFGIPLMMLFVANIGSTMAKTFVFVFVRIRRIFCCKMSNKKRRALIIKNRPNIKDKNNHSVIVIDEKLPMSKLHEETIENTKITKLTSKPTKNENIQDLHLLPKQISSSMSEPTARSKKKVDNSSNLQQLPADIRLNILTGIQNTSKKSSSLSSSTHSVGEKSKDAIVRINELIRQSSAQDTDEVGDDEQHRRRSIDMSQIQYYINETNKLTSNLDNSTDNQQTASTDQPNEKSSPVDQVESDKKQVTSIENNLQPLDDEKLDESKKSSKKNLKRSKSESTHDRRRDKQSAAKESHAKEGESTSSPAKPERRRFFSRKNKKLKKQVPVEEETNEISSNQEKGTTNETLQVDEKSAQRSKSFNQHSTRTLPPPPDYEESTAHETTSIPTTITWKNEHEFYPITTALDLANTDIDLEDEFDDEEEMSVPLLVTVFVIPLYLTLGAILFSIWERWSFLNAFYFCFITLTTIGFGDFVPGSSLKVEAEKEKLISAAVYILFGLVLIAMCVNLMKEQLSQKVKRVASKLGKF